MFDHGRGDVRFALPGFGDCLDNLKKQASDRDPLSPLNDVSTMNETMEYMAYSLPVLSHRLTETVVPAGDCAVYVETVLDWRPQAEAYVPVFDGLTGFVSRGPFPDGRPEPVAGTDRWGGKMIDVSDDGVLRAFAVNRTGE